MECLPIQNQTALQIHSDALQPGLVFLPTLKILANSNIVILSSSNIYQMQTLVSISPYKKLSVNNQSETLGSLPQPTQLFEILQSAYRKKLKHEFS